MADVATLIVAISARGAVKGAKQYAGAVRGMTTANKRAATGMDNLKAAALKLFAAIGGAVAFKKMTNLIMDFQDIMAQIEGVTSATTAQMKEMNNVARDLGATTRFTATQAGEGLLNLSRAGFTVAESSAAIASTLDLATAAVMDLGQASDITSKTIKQFDLDASEAGRVADVLTNSANRATTVVPDLAQALSFAGAAARSAGVSLEETVAAIAVLQERGIEGSRAGAGLRQAMIRLVNPTKEAEKAIFNLGLRMDEVDPTKVGIIESFRRLRDAQMGLGEAAKIFGSRQATAALILSQSVERVDQLTESNKRAEGTARRMAKLLEETLGGAWKELISTVQEVILQIGEAGFAGAVEDAIRFVTALIRELAGIRQETSAVTPAVAGTAEALRRVYDITKLIIKLALPLILAKVAIAIWGVVAALHALLLKIVLVNIALAKLIVGLSVGLTMALLSVAKIILGVLVPALAVFAAAYLGFKFGQWIEQFEPVQKFMRKAIEGFAKLWEWLKKTSRTIWATMKSLFITLFIQPIQLAFREMVDALFKGINWIAKKTRDAIHGIPGTAAAYESLSKVIGATAGGFRMEIARDTVVEDAKMIENEYQAALREIEKNTERVFAKIEKGPKVAPQGFTEMIQADMKKAVDAMNLFGQDSKEADAAVQAMKDNVAKLRAEMAMNNTEAAKQVSLWDRAKAKVTEWGQTALNWFQRVGAEQDSSNKKSEKMLVTLEDIGGAAAGTLTDLALGATSFKEALADVTDQIIRMAVQMAIMSAFSTPGVGGNPVPKGAKGLVAMASGGIVNGPTPALIGERGPEAVVPLTRGEDGKLGLVGGGAGDTKIEFNLVSPDARGIKDMLLRDPKLIKQMNETYRQGYAID